MYVTPKDYKASIPFVHLIFYIFSLSSRIYNLILFLHPFLHISYRLSYIHSILFSTLSYFFSARLATPRIVFIIFIN